MLCAEKAAFAMPRQYCRIYASVAACLFFIAACPGYCPARDVSHPEVNWGGYLRTIGSITAIDSKSIYGQVDAGPYYDGQVELRLKNEIFLGSRWAVETHYEVVAAGGDTRANNSKLKSTYPCQVPDTLLAASVIRDDQRFFSLTHTLINENDVVIYQRLDRLNVTYSPSWGSIKAGRQALTWGNGMVFNPMDLFNPFAPTTIQRDYKVGDDMVLGQVYFGNHEGQVLYIPRRNSEDDDVSDDCSSYVGKVHLALNVLETDFMAARHYDDDIFGWGATGYLGDAAWRLNAVYTRVSDRYEQDDFLQAVANIDYAWQWAGKNIYGLLEFYYNGLGRKDDYAQALETPYILDRLARGYLFSLGRYYMAGLLQIELHPLVHNDWTWIANVEDPSGVLLPQLIWDATTNTQLILGAQWHWGADGTEHGGFNTSLGPQTIKIIHQDRIYLWLTYSF